MSQEGKQLAKRLGQQRNWLRSTFESLNLNKQRGFVLELKNLVRFLDEAFHYNSKVTDNSHLKSLNLVNEGLVLVCLDFLSRARHDICVGSLSRYYSQAIESGRVEDAEAVSYTHLTLPTIYSV